MYVIDFPYILSKGKILCTCFIFVFILYISQYSIRYIIGVNKCLLEFHSTHIWQSKTWLGTLLLLSVFSLFFFLPRIKLEIHNMIIQLRTFPFLFNYYFCNGSSHTFEFSSGVLLGFPQVAFPVAECATQALNSVITHKKAQWLN